MMQRVSRQHPARARISPTCQGHGDDDQMSLRLTPPTANHAELTTVLPRSIIAVEMDSDIRKESVLPV